VEDVEEFGDTIRAFYMLPPMKGRRVGIVSYTGGFGVMGIDACQKFGLEVAKFSSATTARLRALYPSWQGVGNPADIAPSFLVAKKELFETLGITVEALLDDPGIDAVLCILGVFDISQGIGYCKVAEKATTTHPDKPLMFYFYGSSVVAEAKGVLEAGSKSMVFPSPDRAIRALGHLADYSEFRRACDRLPL
jgi:acetyltransferase